MASGITKPAEKFKGKQNTHYHWMIAHMPYPNISCNFFMPIIAKHQPLHKPSIQSPPPIAAIFIF